MKDQHKNMGGVHMSAAHTAKTQKDVRTLENRLDKVFEQEWILLKVTRLDLLKSKERHSNNHKSDSQIP